MHVPSAATTLEQYPMFLVAVQHNALFACAVALAARVMFPVVEKFPVKLAFPFTSKVVAGAVVPMPTLPLTSILCDLGICQKILLVKLF